MCICLSFLCTYAAVQYITDHKNTKQSYIIVFALDFVLLLLFFVRISILILSDLIYEQRHVVFGLHNKDKYVSVEVIVGLSRV